MNTYLIPICYINNSVNDIIPFRARNIEDCKNKIMQYLIYSLDAPDYGDYDEFKTAMDNDYDIILGEITDLEEL